MNNFQTKSLPTAPDVVAPDGSDVRVLLHVRGGSMAHFTLGPGQTSTAVTHRTVEEIWFFLSGRGELWRKQVGENRQESQEDQAVQEKIVRVEAGVCLTIPVGTHFQFRALGDEPLVAVGVTMPPWPGDGEAVVVAGIWTPSTQ